MPRPTSRKNVSVAQRLAFGTLVAPSLLGSAISGWRAQVIAAKVERVVEVDNAMSDAGATVREIESSVERVTAIISEISAASAEQSAGIGQVSGSVQQLETKTQQNAALVEESASAAESLRDQADRLNTLVQAFRLE